MDRKLQKAHKPPKEYIGKLSQRKIEHYTFEVAAALAFRQIKVKIQIKDIRKAGVSKQSWKAFILAILYEIPEGNDLNDEQKRDFVKDRIDFPWGY